MRLDVGIRASRLGFERQAVRLGGERRGTNAQTQECTNISPPCVLQDSIPFGAAARKGWVKVGEAGWG